MYDIIENLPWNKKMEVLRIANNWSQEEAARRCFTGQKNYWSWEKGVVYPRRNSRRAISQAFKVKENDIFR